MRIETNAANRKDVVKAVSGILGQPSKYMGVPTCAYQIGNCTIDKSGAVETEDEKTAELIRAGLLEQGFIEGPEPETETGEATVSLAMERMTAEGLRNLIYLIHSKQYLINRAFSAEVFRIPAALMEELGSAELPDTDAFLQIFQKHECKGIGFPDGKATFILPDTDDTDMVRVFTQLAAAMAQQAKEQKRIKPDETIEENEKYYMRIWLLRLGFGGEEGKETRNLLLRNLKGNAAFRTEAGREKWQEARRNEREAVKQQGQASAEETADRQKAELAEAAADAVLIEQVNQSFGAEE